MHTVCVWSGVEDGVEGGGGGGVSVPTDTVC